jgi:serine/threonine protein kinase
MNSSMSDERPLKMQDFADSVRRPRLVSIDGDARFYNLAPGYWVYDEMLACMHRTGWVRFAPGFKAGLYGHPDHPYCIKILGMGVGENPRYFCERGYYLEHERRMLDDFRAGGFAFGPHAVPREESIRFLVDVCGVGPAQAEMRVLRHDVLVMEYIPGVPLAMQVGRQISYQTTITHYEAVVVEAMVAALERLRASLVLANRAGFLHNDPMPPNLLFTLGDLNAIEARLVDFELAQNLGTESPPYVNNSVAELYRERNVPVDPQSGRPTKNLDEHLMDESIRIARIGLEMAARGRSGFLKWLNDVRVSVSFFGVGIEFGPPK